MNADQRARTRALNDALRSGHRGGRIHLTCGVMDLAPTALLAVIEAVAQFDRFDVANDPYDEHDFGAVTVGAQQVFWKIDYYDPTLTRHADDPSDSETCTRVMTLMLASEY